MRRSSIVALVFLAATTEGLTAAAQTPPPPPAAGAPGTPPPTAAPPAAPAPAAPAAAPAAPPEAAPAPAPAAAPAPGAPAPAGATPPAAPTPSVLDKITADAFVDTYGSFNSNNPKPQAPLVFGVPAGGNQLRAFDVAEGFAVNWLGVNATYAADPIGGTIGLRMGPGAVLYHLNSSDETAGLQYVKQAYATWKPADKVTLDLGKWDQPFGSEVADSQLNMNYGRSLLFTFAQPLWFTGLRADFAVADQLDIKAFVVNGWNNTIDNNRGKSFGAQIMVKPADQAILYLGYVTGPEQADFVVGPAAAGAGTPPVTTTATGTDVPDANDTKNWRHLIDFVADINPTSALRFLLNADYRTEGLGTHNSSIYGANLVIKYAFTDAFSAALRGEYYHDEHGDTVPSDTKGGAADIEDGTLTLMYGVGSHLNFMLDGRYDNANNKIFQKNTNDAPTDGQFTLTLGVIASTK